MLEKKHTLEKYDNFFSPETKIMFDEFTQTLNKKINIFLIEGLKRKGFVLKNRVDLVQFIKENCRCEDRQDLKQKTYFVNNIPFLLHEYESKPPFEVIQTYNSFMICDYFGTFSLL